MNRLRLGAENPIQDNRDTRITILMILKMKYRITLVEYACAVID